MRIRTALRVARGLIEFAVIAACLLAILGIVLAISAWILSVGIADLGLLLGILVSIPFLFVVWLGGMYIAGTIRRAIWP